jgi:hypothetical protein
MQNYVSLSLWHAVELGYEASQPLAEWASRQALTIARSTEPRHIADYVLPDVKNDGAFYQSLEDLYDGYSHNADGAYPSTMPLDSTKGFSGAGAVGSYAVTFEGYGSIAAASIAMAGDGRLQTGAWGAIKAWHHATKYYDHDPRYAIIPRE